jgi:hypothetical protein
MAEMLHVHGPEPLWHKVVGSGLVEHVWCRRFCFFAQAAWALPYRFWWVPRPLSGFVLYKTSFRWGRRLMRSHIEGFRASHLSPASKHR